MALYPGIEFKNPSSSHIPHGESGTWIGEQQCFSSFSVPKNHLEILLKYRQITEWEKIAANGMTDKGVISKIYKQLIQLNIRKKTKNTIFSMGRRLG